MKICSAPAVMEEGAVALSCDDRTTQVTKLCVVVSCKALTMRSTWMVMYSTYSDGQPSPHSVVSWCVVALDTPLPSLYMRFVACANIETSLFMWSEDYGTALNVYATMGQRHVFRIRSFWFQLIQEDVRL
jgi:hypothetical protein